MYVCVHLCTYIFCSLNTGNVPSDCLETAGLFKLAHDGSCFTLERFCLPQTVFKCFFCCYGNSRSKHTSIRVCEVRHRGHIRSSLREDDLDGFCYSTSYFFKHKQK